MTITIKDVAKKAKVSIATVSLVLCSPSLQAYVRPIHTREDPLAYLLVILGLTFLFRREYGPMTVASMAAATVPE